MNQRDEQRVVEALQAFTGGLTVTEQDILNANNKLKDNLEPSSPRRRLAMVAIVAAAAIVAGFVIFAAIDDDNETDSQGNVVNQPETPAEVLTAAVLEGYAYTTDDFSTEPAPTAAQLNGLWVLRPYGTNTAPMLVTGNASYRIGSSGPLSGTATLSGRTWTRTTPEAGCPATQTYTTAIAPDRSLILQVAPEDNTCTITDGLEVWDPVAPGTPVADYLLAVAEDAAWESSPQPVVKPGLYVAPRTGHILEVTREGTHLNYRFFDNLSADKLVPAEQGELFTEPATLAASCAGGTFSGKLETARFPGVEDVLAETTALRLSAGNDQCASGIASDDVWVRLVERFR